MTAILFVLLTAIYSPTGNALGYHVDAPGQVDIQRAFTMSANDLSE
jgi:hypothetical protein